MRRSSSPVLQYVQFQNEHFKRNRAGTPAARGGKQARTDYVAKDKGFVCERCGEAIPREGWGIQSLCSVCQQIKSNL
jgi:hypothetical protein